LTFCGFAGTLRRIRMNVMAILIQFLALSLALAVPSGAFGAESEKLPAPTGTGEETNSQEMLRSYLQLQEQIHAIQLAVEQAHQQTDEVAAQAAKAVGGRLDEIDKALNTQRSRELDVVQSSLEAQQKSLEAQQKSNNVMLIVAGSFASVGFAALALMAFFQWRTIQRLGELSAAIPARALNPQPAIAVLGPGEGNLARVEPAEQASQRLAGAIDRLEKRIREMEHTAQPPLKDAPPAHPEFTVTASPANGKSIPAPANGTPTAAVSAAGTATSSPDDPRVRVLLGKGESMLNLDNAEGALACFEEALALEAENADALVKKGTAHEKLRQMDEALECYDRAIKADASMTIAYLYKGGLCNRMERFTEALECYEQALRAQENQKA